MLGVVLWSDDKDRKAVFWCEDQGDLAFYDGSRDIEPAIDAAFFDAGDMVSFDVVTDMKLRKAVNARLVQHNVCSDLPGALRCATPPKTEARILPFTPRARTSDRAAPAKRRENA